MMLVLDKVQARPDGTHYLTMFSIDMDAVFSIEEISQSVIDNIEGQEEPLVVFKIQITCHDPGRPTLILHVAADSFYAALGGFVPQPPEYEDDEDLDDEDEDEDEEDEEGGEK